MGFARARRARRHLRIRAAQQSPPAGGWNGTASIRTPRGPAGPCPDRPGSPSTRRFGLNRAPDPGLCTPWSWFRPRSSDLVRNRKAREPNKVGAGQLSPFPRSTSQDRPRLISPTSQSGRSASDGSSPDPSADALPVGPAPERRHAPRRASAQAASPSQAWRVPGVPRRSRRARLKWLPLV